MSDPNFEVANRTDDLAQSTETGRKYRSVNGSVAIRNGIKAQKVIASETKQRKKPDWIRIRVQNNPNFTKLKKTVKQLNLATVCEESHCPNISECWSHSTATLMLMGAICTRACRFCAVDTGNPNGALDPDEPQHAADAVASMGLDYVVLTSVDRDDLPLGGAEHYARVIQAIKRTNPSTVIEALTPDFAGSETAVQTVTVPELEVFAHNIETVRRLTPRVRDPRATFDQSLKVLQYAQQHGAPYTKSGLMLGLGETKSELQSTFDELRSVGTDFLTLGQYLQPTQFHLPVERYIPPSEFDSLKDLALSFGFAEVTAGPLVRSSYRAERSFKNAQMQMDR